jgi:misacylated tRNA(Ala) deacylase
MMTRALYQEDAYLRSCDALVVRLDPRGVVLDQTVFYPNGGGQPGDHGLLRRADGSAIAVVDTVKGEVSGEIVHVLAESELPFQVGEPVYAEIDWARRYAHMCYHTALHLLCAVVSAPVTGGQIAVDKARADFAIAMEALDKDVIETRLNALIAAGHAVRSGSITDAELDAQPGLVKTMSVSPPRGLGSVRLIEIDAVDLQPCGGTHVRNTAEIGRLVVQKIRSEGKQNKRVVIALAEPL